MADDYRPPKYRPVFDDQVLLACMECGAVIFDDPVTIELHEGVHAAIFGFLFGAQALAEKGDQAHG